MNSWEETCFQSFHGILAFYEPNQISSFGNKCQALKHQTLRTLGSLITFCLFGSRARMGGFTDTTPTTKASLESACIGYGVVWGQGPEQVESSHWGDLHISSGALASGEPTQRVASSNIIFVWKYTAFKMPLQVLSSDAKLSLCVCVGTLLVQRWGDRENKTECLVQMNRVSFRQNNPAFLF